MECGAGLVETQGYIICKRKDGGYGGVVGSEKKKIDGGVEKAVSLVGDAEGVPGI